MSFMIFTHSKLLLGWSNQGKCDARGTWNVWERKYNAHRMVMGKPS